MRKNVVIGKVKIESFGMKYLSAVRPSFQLVVEKEIFTSTMATFNYSFTFSDISTEILVLVMDEAPSSVNKSSKSAQPFGQIVIPIANYISLFKALPTSRQWHMFFPLYKNGRAGRFRDGCSSIASSSSSSSSGSGLPKTREKIGFVDLAVTVQLMDSHMPIYRYYFARPVSSAYVRVERPYVETTVAEDSLRLQRALQNLRDLFLLVRFPEVIALISLGGFLCFSLQPWQVPLVLFMIAALNGLLLKTRRNYDSVVVFNSFLSDEAGNPMGGSLNPSHHGSSALTSGKASSFLIPLSQLDLGSDEELTLAGIAADYAGLLEKVVVTLERIVNLWGLADLKPSLIVYGAVLVGSCACSLFLLFFSVRALCFFFLGTILFVASLWGPLSYILMLDLVRLRHSTTSPPMRKADEEESDWNARNRAYTISRALPWPVLRLWEFLWSLHYFWTRVPDELDLVHRHIAGLSIVKNNGSEMEEAEEFYKKE